jgi:hypothetical protein
MAGLGKKLLVAIGALLVLSLTVSGFLWYQWAGIKHELNTTRTLLDTTKTQLDAVSLEVQNTKVQLDATRTQLDASKTELATVRAQFDVAKGQWEAEQREISDQYSNLRGQVNRRLGQGQDCQGFVTPDEPAVSAIVQAVAGSYKQDVNQRWADYERLYRWVVANIKYNKDSYIPVLPERISGVLTWGEDCWRMPAETLNDKAGDCEDMACLLASMLLNYGQGQSDVFLLEIWSTEPKVLGHIAVAFPVTGGKLTILDPAGNYFTGCYSGRGLNAEDFALETNNWLSHWEGKIPNAQVSAVFSDKFYRAFSSTQEFIDWVRSR